MRVIAYIGILALALMAPVERVDVAHLKPVEVVFAYKDGDAVILSTDTEATGRGEDAAAALSDLRQTTSGVVYLDTAEYLLVSEDAVDEIDVLRSYLKGSVKLCLAKDVQVKEVAKYLEVHGNLPKLKDWKTGDKLPTLEGKKILKKL